MRAALRSGLRWPTICNGAAICGFCHVRILSSECELPAVSVKESRGLQNVEPPDDGPGTRLACQLVLSGTCVVEREDVRRG
jgi:ferredoxin